MFPVLDSTMVYPGFSCPCLSASSIILWATLSLMLPVGFMYSSLAQTSASRPSVTLLSLTSGVFPMSSVMLSNALIWLNPVMWVDKTCAGRVKPLPMSDIGHIPMMLH